MVYENKPIINKGVNTFERRASFYTPFLYDIHIFIFNVYIMLVICFLFMCKENILKHIQVFLGSDMRQKRNMFLFTVQPNLLTYNLQIF